MLKAGEVHVWRVELDRLDPKALPPPTPGEEARAAAFHSEEARRRYLRAHAALRGILAECTGARLDFALTERGKPYLPGAPELRFNLSRSHGMALVGASLGVDIGVDIERLRALPECLAIAARFFPPSEAAAFALTPPEDRERDFFRRWTRIEAMLKARGIGLYGAGAELGGKWTVQEIEIGGPYAAAIAGMQDGMQVTVHDYH